MKKRFLNFIEKWASWKNILILFVLQMLFNLVIMPSASSSDTHDLPILDLQFFYTPQQAYAIIGAYTPELRQAAAISRLSLDVIYPLIYGLMLTFLLVVTLQRAFRGTSLKDQLLFLPWGGVLFDYLENIGLATMLLSYPKKFVLLAWFTAGFTSLKWILIVLSFLLVLIGAVKLAFIKKH
ncbi:MAG: hypothetical protein HN392_00925 [Anaerolineae bacterium]|jgi:hypothetical protein|nr:hypothetical protein [Anaerolineae bacterium]MBT7074095.1 hypothetical protein [Anaerolineae bacterium]MBT7783650.1 hypothetical protein [Anaerolineae bacterium]